MQPDFFNVDAPALLTLAIAPRPQPVLTTQPQPARTNAPAPRANQPQPARTAPKQQPAPPQKPQGHASIFHDITHNPITNFVGNDVVKPTLKGGAQFINQGVQEGKQVLDTARMEAANATHNPVAFSNANKQSQRDYSGFGNKGGIGNVGTITTKGEAQAGSAHGAEKIAGDTAMLASWLLPGAGKGAEEGASLAGRAGLNALRGGAAGAIYGAGSGAYQGGNAKEVAKSAALNAILGGALGGGGTLATGGAKKVIQAVGDNSNAIPVKSLANLTKMANQVKQARANGESDKTIKQILETGQYKGATSNRPTFTRTIEQNQNKLTDNQRLQITHGDTGQAGLRMNEADRNALLAKFRDQARNSNLAHNQTGAVGKNVNGDMLDAKSYAKVFGTSVDEARQHIANLNKPDSPILGMKMSDYQQAAEDSKLSAEEKGNLPADRQTALSKYEGNTAQLNKQLGSKKVAQTDAENPVKVSIASVNPNDPARFQHARAIPQQASEPIRAATFVASQSAKDAGLSVSDLADRVEHPEEFAGKMSPKEQLAVSDWQHLTNLVNATSHALGGKEARLDNFFKHAVDTEGWAHTGESPVFDAKTGKVADASGFKGVDAISRKTDEAGNIKYPDLRSLHDAGMKLKNEDNVQKFINSYGGSAAYKVEKQALTKAFQEADGGVEAGAKTESLNLHDGKPLILSKEAAKQARAYMHEDSSTLGKIIDKPGSAMKHILLSASQYHPTNINLLQAAPSLALQGHPIRAGKGLIDTVANAVDKGRSLDQMREDLHSGAISKSALIGSPMYRTDFTPSGTTPKLGQTVFGRQIPAMHRQVNAAVLQDLEKRGIDLNSKAARDAGEVANNTMGFYNAAAKNLDPRVQRTVSRFLLAPQFEMSKLNTVAKAFDPRTAPLARRNALTTIFGKYGTEVGLALGVGAALHQKQDNPLDVAKEVAVNPYIPTPLKDSKGNTIKFKLPDSGASEITNLVTGLDRGQNGRLKFTPNNPGEIASNVVTDFRDKSSPVFATGTKLATNQNYAGKPLHQPGAPAGTQAEQDAATIVPDLMPIGLQGAVYTKPVESHLPGNVQTVLNNNKPGTNPLFKSGLTTVAATPETDTTTGKGLETKQFYDALDKAKSTLPPNSPQLGAFLESFGATKDPVTGQYTVTPNSEMTVAKASSLNAYPDAAKAANQMAQQLKASGQKVDPYYLLTPQQQKAYNAYETMAPLSADRTDWLNKNSWYNDFAKQQSDFFAGLPKGDPNKPSNPIKFPSTSGQLTTNMNMYYSIAKDNTQGKTDFLNSHPDVVSQLNAQFNYDNAVRVARGYAAVKGAPQPSDAVQKFMTQYDSADKATRAQLRNSNPNMYQNMIAFFDSASLNTIADQSGVTRLQGEPNTTNSELKDIASLSSDIYKNPQGTYAIIPAGWMNGNNGNFTPAASGSSSSYSSSSTPPVFHAPTTVGNEFAKLASLNSSTEKLKSAPKLKYYKSPANSLKIGKVGKVSKPKLAKSVKAPKLLKPSRASSISRSSKTGQRVVLSI